MSPLLGLSRVLLSAAALTVGGGSILAFVLFLVFGPVQLVDLGLAAGAALIWNAALSALFFAQHSLMVRRSLRQRLSKLIPEAYQGAWYALASGFALILVMVLWQVSSQTLFSAQGYVRWLFHGLLAISIVGSLWTFFALGDSDLLGLDAAKRGMDAKPPPRKQLIVRGAYRWVRHPAYLFTLLLLWSSPELSADRLLLNVLWSSWIVLGTVLEERDLVADFGSAYRDYQRRVPMLLPWRPPTASPERAMRRPR